MVNPLLRAPRAPSVGSLLRSAPSQVSEQEVLEAEQQIQEKDDSSNFLFDILRVPSRLLGGEMIKGFLAGVGEEGLGEGLRRAGRDNPLFQLLDVLPGVDIAQETDFDEIRASGLFGDALDVENQFGQLAIDLTGELLTSPLELFFTPFGKVGSALKAGSNVAPDLAKAVEAGQRTMLAFKVPFSEKGFSVTPFRSLDVYSARVLQATADFLNTNPVTSQVMGLFRGPQALSVADATQRAAGQEFFQAAQIAGREREAQFLPMLNRIFQNAPEQVLQDPELQRMLLTFAELGVTRADEALDVQRLLRAGIPHREAVALRESVLSAFSDVGRQARELTREINRRARNGERVSELVDEYRRVTPPGTALPRELLRLSDEELTRAGVTLRRGIDTRNPTDGSFLSIDEPLAEIQRGAGDVPRPEGLPAPLTSSVGDGVAARARIAEGTEGTLQEALRVQREEVLPTSFSRLFDENEDLFESMTGLSEDLRLLMDQVGEQDIGSRLLETMSEHYVPRDLSPEVRQAIQKQWSKFDKKRDITQMTIFEANAYLQENGTKLTGFRAVKDLDTEDPTGIWKLWEKVFPDDFVATLQQMGPDGQRAAEFFNTNPVRAFYRRIQKSAEGTSRREYERLALERGSPMISGEFTAAELLKDAGKVQSEIDQGRLFVVLRDGAAPKTVAPEEMLSQAALFDQRAKVHVANKELGRWIDETLATGEKTAQEVLQDMRVLRDLEVRNKALLRSPLLRGDPTKITEQTGRRVRNLQQQLKDLDETPFRDHPLAQNLRQQVDMLSHWEQKAVDLLPEAERAALRGDPVPGIDRLKAQNQADVSGLVDRRNQVTKRLKSLRAQRKTLAKDPAANAGRLMELEKEIARKEDSLSFIRSGISQRQETIKTLNKDRRSTRKYLKQIEEKGANLRAQAFKELADKESEIREGVKAGIDVYEGQLETFVTALAGNKADARQVMGQLLRGERAGLEETTKNLNDYLRLWRAHSENGTLAFDELQKAYPEIAERMLKGAKDTRVVSMDSALYQQTLDPRTGVWSRLNAPDTMAHTFRILDRLTSFWKAWTVLPPVFVQSRMRDVLSSTIMQVQGGLNPARIAGGFTDAMPFLRGMGRFLETGDSAAINAAKVAPELLTAAGVKTNKELFEKLYSHGIVNNALLRDQYVLAAGDVAVAAGKRRGVDVDTIKGKLTEVYDATLGTRGGVIQTGAQFAEFLDNEVKVGALFAHLRAGKSFDDAAQTVRAWAYDPRRVDLSHFERYKLRRFIPFYTWLKKAVTSQAQAFIEKPGAVSFWQKFAESAENLTGLTPAEYELVMPEFIQDNFGIPTSVDADGTIRVRMFGDALPLGAVGRVADALADTFDRDTETEGIGDFVFSNMNPWIKVPMELAMNESSFTQQPIADFEGEQVEYMGVTMPAEIRHIFTSIRLLNEIDRLNVIDASQIAALFGHEDKSLSDLFGDFQRAGRGTTTAVERLLGSALSPIPAKEITKDVKEISRRRANREKVDQNLLKGRLKRELERGTEASRENIEVLRRLIAEQEAKVRILGKVEQR